MAMGLAMGLHPLLIQSKEGPPPSSTRPSGAAPHPVADHEFLACSAAMKGAETMGRASLAALKLRGTFGLETGRAVTGVFGGRMPRGIGRHGTGVQRYVNGC
jgi:hypothetical protein